MTTPSWGCGHVTDEQGNVLNIKCVQCYLDWYLDEQEKDR